MNRLSTRSLVACALLGVGAWGVNPEAIGQSSGGAVPSLAPNDELQAMQASSNALVAPGAGMMGDPTGGAGGASRPSGLLGNPMAAPVLYNSMIGATLPQTPQSAASANLATTQLGLMMMYANQQNGGIGSGRISGTRRDPRKPSNPGAQPTASGKPASTNPPGGLAARYFNRTNGRAPTPKKNYFNRRPGYFP